MMVAPVSLPQLHDPAWLEREYVAARRSTVDIARQLGCSPATVHTYLKRHGIPLRPKGGQRLAIAELDRPEWLRRQYLHHRRSLEDIAAELGCSTGTIKNRLRSHNIALRPPGHTTGPTRQQPKPARHT